MKISDHDPIWPDLLMCFGLTETGDGKWVETWVHGAPLGEGCVLSERDIEGFVEAVYQYGTREEALDAIQTAEFYTVDWWSSDDQGGAQVWNPQQVAENVLLVLRHKLVVGVEKMFEEQRKGEAEAAERIKP